MHSSTLKIQLKKWYLNWLKEKIDFFMLIQGDMPSLLNHNMEGGSRHETNEFSQNTTLSTFQNGMETSLYDSWLRLHPPNYFTNQVRVIE
ncbi:hypothetical protein AAG906_008517 [Vitis piasezkii]